MNDLCKILLLGHTVDNVTRSLGYTEKSCIPWGKVGLCVGLDILNGTVRSAKRSSHKSYRRKRF